MYVHFASDQALRDFNPLVKEEMLDEFVSNVLC